jgi:hypothetical protein
MEITRAVLVVFRRITIDDVPEDQRIEEREDLVDRRQHQRCCQQALLLTQVRDQNLHRSSLID